MSENGKSERNPDLSSTLIALFKGVVYRDRTPEVWQDLLQLQARVQDNAAVFGLNLIVDEAEGYAHLRQRPRQEGEPERPKLVQRRQLSYPVSLLLALMRKKLAEHDSGGGDIRLILSRDQIVDLVRLFTADSTNEARLVDRVGADINRIVDMGFLRRLRGQEDQYEVRRILKAFVDAQWLAEFDRNLSQYRDHLVEENG